MVDLLNARLAKRSVLSEREVLKIFSDVVIAVGRLHHRTKPIIHRDLKVSIHHMCTAHALCSVNRCGKRVYWLCHKTASHSPPL